jgi:hypothetical protein
VSGATRVQSHADDGKMKAFKSKKELVFLAVASVVFVGVILKMYVLKGGDMAGPAEEPPAAVGAPESPAWPAPSPGSDNGTTPALSDLENLAIVRPEAPARLARNPFVMSTPMREQIFQVAKPPEDAAPKTTTEIVTLTPANMKETLAAIPGSERALQYGLKLSGVMLSGDIRAAVINQRVVMQGQHYLGFQVIEVQAESAVLQRGDYRVRIEIPKFEHADNPYSLEEQEQ